MAWCKEMLGWLLTANVCDQGLLGRACPLSPPFSRAGGSRGQLGQLGQRAA